MTCVGSDLTAVLNPSPPIFYCTNDQFAAKHRRLAGAGSRRTETSNASRPRPRPREQRQGSAPSPSCQAPQSPTEIIAVARRLCRSSQRQELKPWRRRLKRGGSLSENLSSPPLRDGICSWSPVVGTQVVSYSSRPAQMVLKAQTWRSRREEATGWGQRNGGSLGVGPGKDAERGGGRSWFVVPPWPRWPSATRPRCLGRACWGCRASPSPGTRRDPPFSRGAPNPCSCPVSPSPTVPQTLPVRRGRSVYVQTDSKRGPPLGQSQLLGKRVGTGLGAAGRCRWKGTAGMQDKLQLNRFPKPQS